MLRPLFRPLARPAHHPWLVLFALTAACSSGTGRPVRLGDGSYSLSCKGPLTNCLKHAERLCKDDGYTVSEARDVQERAGHASGQSQVVIQKSDATIHCGTQAPRPPIELKRPEPEPAPAAAPPPTSAPAAPAPKPAAQCVPGSTQACIGPAGCTGGQACKADGSGYEVCNCGAPAAAP
jgi:hypothetical protein